MRGPCSRTTVKEEVAPRTPKAGKRILKRRLASRGYARHWRSSRLSFFTSGKEGVT